METSLADREPGNHPLEDKVQFAVFAAATLMIFAGALLYLHAIARYA